MSLSVGQSSVKPRTPLKFWWLYVFLGSAPGAMSLVMLVSRALNVSFVSAFQLAVDWYEEFTSDIFGPLEPYLNAALAYVQDWVDWDLHLRPHWKHVFLLLVLFFGAGTRVRFVRRLWADGVGVATMALIFSLATGVASGTVPLEQGHWSGDILVVTIPVVGIALYDLCLAGWTSLLYRPHGVKWLPYAQLVARTYLSLFLFLPMAATFTVGALSYLLVDREMLLNTVRSPGLAFLGVFLISLTVISILVGTIWASSNPDDGEDHWHKYRRSATKDIGFFMLSAIAGATAFVLANAGWQLIRHG